MKLEEKVGAFLAARGLSLATAESCTGGLVGHRLTNVSGSSSYYLGGSVIGSAAGWPWGHGGWPGVVVVLIACVSGVIAIAMVLRRLPEN